MDPSCSAAAGRRGETSGVGAALPGQAQTTAQSQTDRHKWRAVAMRRC
jgi:hypothetical protein